MLGATALIAASQNEIGWLYIGIIALSAAITVTIALLINNIERRWPVFWWTPKTIVITNKDETIGQTLPSGVSSHELSPQSSITMSHTATQRIVVSPYEIVLPAHFSQEDRDFLKSLQERLSQDRTTTN
jgi:HPP family